MKIRAKIALFMADGGSRGEKLFALDVGGMACRAHTAMKVYRQEQQFLRLGVEISRANMANWAMQVAKALIPLIIDPAIKYYIKGRCHEVGASTEPEGVEKAAIRHLRKLQKLPERVKSYFRHEPVRHAA